MFPDVDAEELDTCEEGSLISSEIPYRLGHGLRATQRVDRWIGLALAITAAVFFGYSLGTIHSQRDTRYGLLGMCPKDLVSHRSLN